MHLNLPTYRALLDGTLPAAERRTLCAHLETACEDCEAFLVERGEVGADALDGLVDSALARLATREAEAGNDIEFQKIRKAAIGAPKARRAVAPRLAVAAALLVALAASLLASQKVGQPAFDGVKGEPGASAISLRLRFLVITPVVGGEPSIEKGISGEEVPAGASLQFEVELGRAAFVTLARVGGAAEPEVFFERQLTSGRSVVTAHGQPAAYPLRSLNGSQRFIALASDLPIDRGDVARAAELGASQRRGEGRPISLDLVEVRVRP
jgi:hypothetical protein